MQMKNIAISLMACIGCCLSASILRAQALRLENAKLKLQWHNSGAGYVLSELQLRDQRYQITVPDPKGQYTILYSEVKPDSTPHFPNRAWLDLFRPYTYHIKKWNEAFCPVPMNTAGEAVDFYPVRAKQLNDGIQFTQETDRFVLDAIWKLDPNFLGDITVAMHIRAKTAGYFSVASPTLYSVPEEALSWGILPGYFQGKALQSNLVLSYAYGHGIPDKPVIVREKAASTLAPLIQDKTGINLSVIADPGMSRDPWAADKLTQAEWRLGLSLMNRAGKLSPTLYRPVLGQLDSYLQPGETRVLKFRYALSKGDWFDQYKHAIYDIYQFKHFLRLKDTKESLTHRLYGMLDYVRADSTSLWRKVSYRGLEIGAQSYFGGVIGSNRDAMKNSDYGAMWMLAKLTGDKVLNQDRLPYVRNFKLVQQQQAEGFFKGAAIGQYYLSNSKRFTEEWGDYVEPIALTYYTMLDIGNILLFHANDEELRARLRAGADKLLGWQKPDGSWEVAYDKKHEQPLFTDIKDLRPTFYGLLVAYRILGDNKYLDAAKRGANWLLQQAVNNGFFLGVCGDARFVPDFATAQTAQAFLDFFDVTKDEKYLEAAKATARIYTASVFTHPIASKVQKSVKGIKREDWEISQTGLSFEHGGLMGSVNNDGPILLASHAGMFVRMFGLTQDSIFLDMARAAAWGRDAFVDKGTHVASYYWWAMNQGAGPYPHHAWWQIGWITDYLQAEASVRSNNLIQFPRGFVTPKVGPHQPYGFKPGEVFRIPADMLLPEKGLQVENERVDYISALSTDKKHFFLILLNNSVDAQDASVQFDFGRLLNDAFRPMRACVLDEKGEKVTGFQLSNERQKVFVPPGGLRVLQVSQ
ncbi:glycerophosphoryl diester phosphodiesterase [Sphingobacterium thalpophilum]